jgi:hypothetical protein
MTYGTQRDQVLLRITATLATKFLVVNLQIRSAPATLASPTIPAQYLFSKLLVQLGIKP